MRLHVAIALGLLAGLSLGLAAAMSGAPWLLGLAQGVEPVGTIFVNLLKMVVVPLVATTLFVGVAGMGDLKRLGGMGVTALVFFALTTVVAVLLGMGIMRLALLLADPAAARAVAATTQVAPPPTRGVVNFLVSLIPPNPVQAAVESALLPLMVFTVLFGAAAGSLPEPRRRPLVALADAVRSPTSPPHPHGTDFGEPKTENG